jgi:hypothetical protein
MAKYWPSAARLSARPVPASVSVIGYVAKLDSRCSPSVTTGWPVASSRLIESAPASSCSARSSSKVIFPSS